MSCATSAIARSNPRAVTCSPDGPTSVPTICTSSRPPDARSDAPRAGRRSSRHRPRSRARCTRHRSPRRSRSPRARRRRAAGAASAPPTTTARRAPSPVAPLARRTRPQTPSGAPRAVARGRRRARRRHCGTARSSRWSAGRCEGPRLADRPVVRAPPRPRSSATSRSWCRSRRRSRRSRTSCRPPGVARRRRTV